MATSPPRTSMQELLKKKADLKMGSKATAAEVLRSKDKAAAVFKRVSSDSYSGEGGWYCTRFVNLRL